MLCRLVQRHKCFRGAYHLHFDGNPRKESCIKENKYYTGRTGKAIGTVGAWEYSHNSHRQNMKKYKKSDKKGIKGV
jgi:hypothetical protein